MTTEHPLAEVLLAIGPAVGAPPDLALFGQFCGNWNLDVCWHDRGSVIRRSRGEWHFGWILGGRAIQDVWIVPPRDEGARGGSYEYGTSIRFFDASAGVWRSTWHGPVQAGVRSFVARASRDGIVLDGQQLDGRDIRWRFLDIAPDSFSWRFEQRSRGGTRWTLLQSFGCRRRGSMKLEHDHAGSVETG